MKFSMLRKINNYIKENGIIFKSIYVSTSYFPKSFNDAIFNRILRLKDISRDELIHEYELYYNDDKLQLIARDKRNKATLVIYDGDIGCSYGYVSFRLREEEIVSEAVALEEEKFIEIQDKIRELGLSDRCSFSINPIFSNLDKSASMCCSYIGYLNDEYQRILLENKDEDYVGIKYEQPESSVISRTGNSIFVGNGTKERVNEILPIDDRRTILESYDYIYSGYAYSSSNKEIDYLCYLYQINEEQYSIIMEPISGNGYMKSLIFEYNGVISKDIFINIVKECLGLSYDESIKANRILLTKHTSIDLFGSVVENIVLGTDRRKKVCYYTKNKISGMRARKGR